MKQGLILVNLGTPDAATLPFVRKYLAEFLADKRVIALPWLLRYLLLYSYILPIRAKRSTKAYQAIWTHEGSPLLLHSQKLVQKLTEKLGDTWQVSLGMRYGNPSLETALKELSECQKISILPLYPQYSSAATGSSIEKLLKLLAKEKKHPHLKIIRDFYNHPSFIKATATIIKPHLAQEEHLLLSYHGIPENHLKTLGCTTICVNSCPKAQAETKACYKAQCEQTSLAIAKELELEPEAYTTSFQSRLGKTAWLKPYTETIFAKLKEKGVKRIAVACPSFTADCLETLEEIGLRAKETWIKLGGEDLKLIPSLNDNETWVQAIIDILELTTHDL